MQAYYGKDYHPRTDDPVEPGADLTDSNGNKAFFVKVSREPEDQDPGRIAVQGVNGQRETYPGVYGLEIR